MKKVKMIIASLIIIFASSFLCACSCSDEPNGGGVNPINVAGISISSDHDRVEVDPETKYLTIRVYKGDTFNITYELTPSNTTATQVNWEFEGKDNIVVPRSNTYSYAQGTTHTIAWQAREVGNTIIKFTTVKGTYFSTQARVIVGEPLANLPSFKAPSDIDYNATTGKVTWSPVNKMIEASGNEINAVITNGQVSGLRGYEVRAKNLSTGADLDPVIVNSCEYELPRGNTYMVTIVAKGDNNETVKDSAVSNPFRFHQIATVSDIKNTNGVIEFKSNMYADNHKLFYSTKEEYKNDSKSIAGEGNTFTFDLNNSQNQIPKISKYDVYVISYPRNYGLGQNAGRNYTQIEIGSENITFRCYPSVAPETPLKIERLTAPVITMNDIKGAETIKTNYGTSNNDQIVFEGANVYNEFTWDITSDYLSELGAHFEYELLRKTNDSWTTVASGENIKKLSMSTIWNQTSYVGDYKLSVATVGNAWNTITSTFTELNFSVLGKMATLSNGSVLRNGDGSSNVGFNTTFSSSESAYNIGGVELYFVKLASIGNGNYAIDTNNSKMTQVTVDVFGTKSVDNYDLSKVGLSAGMYAMYGRFLGFEGRTTTGELTKLGEFSVADKVPDTTSNPIVMTSDGIIKFSPVSAKASDITTFGYDTAKYIVTLSVVSNSGSTQTTQTIIGNASTWGDSWKNIQPYSPNAIYRSQIQGYSNGAFYTQIKDSNNIASNYISVHDIIACILIGGGVVDENTVMMAVNSIIEGSQQINVSITRYGDDTISELNSVKSADLKFFKVAPVTTLELSNYNLEFDSVGQNIDYLIEINGHYSYVSSGPGSHYSVNLNELYETDISGNSYVYDSDNKQILLISRAVPENNTVSVSITAIGTTTRTGLNGDGQLNSITNTKAFPCTMKPENISSIQDGTIYWDILSNETNDQDLDYRITFYYQSQDDNQYILFNNSLRVLTGSATLVGDVNQNIADEEGTGEIQVKIGSRYSTNISSRIDEIYSELGYNCNLRIIVELVNENKFTMASSDYYYIVKLPAVELNYVMSGNNYAIDFTTLTFTDDIEYSLNVYKNNVLITTNPISIDNVEKGVTITRILGDMTTTVTTPDVNPDDQENGENGDENVDPASTPMALAEREDTINIISGIGEYKIEIFAHKTTNVTNDENNPYVISGKTTDIVVKIISNQISASGEGETITWNPIHDDATYILEYKAPSSSTYTVIQEANADKVFTKDDLTNGKFVYDVSGIFTSNGEYLVRVIPTIDYETTGYILTNDTSKTNSVHKLSKPNAIVTENGMIKVTMLRPENVDAYSVLVQVDDKNMSSDAYIMTKENDGDNVVLYISITDSQYTGSHTYRVMVSALGQLNSEFSDPLTAEKLDKTSIQKVNESGEWLAWDILDNATGYELKFNYKGESDSTTIVINYNSTTSKYEVKTDTGYTDSEELIKVVGTQIYYKFDESVIVNGKAGDYEYRITPKTTKSGYLNGVVSDIYNIHKLNNKITVNVNGDSIELSDYDTIVDPDSITFTLTKVKTVTVTETIEGDEGTPTETEKQIICGVYSATVNYASIKDLIAKSNSGDSGEENPDENIETNSQNVYAINLNNIYLQNTDESGNITSGSFLADAGSYNFTLTFNGNGVTTLNSDTYEHTEQIIKLDTTTPYTRDGVISWQNVTDVTDYTLRFNSSSLDEPVYISDIQNNFVTDEELNEKGLILNKNEYYTVELMSNASGKLSSVWSNVFVVKKLYAPVSLGLTSDTQSAPMLTWSNPNADNQNIDFIMDFGTSDDDTDDTIIYNVGSGLELNGQLLSLDKKPGKYDLRLKSRGNTSVGAGAQRIIVINGNVYEISSDNKIIIDDVTYTLSGSTVVIPTTFNVEGNIVNIDGVDYEVVEDKINYKGIDYAVTEGQVIVNMVYTEVSSGMGLLTSDWSEDQISAEYITNPEGLKVVNGEYTWESKTGAYGYRVTFLNKSDEVLYSTVTTNPTYTFSNNEFTGSGYFKISIETLITPDKGIVSKDEETVNTTLNFANLYRSPIVEDLRVQDGMITWNVKMTDVIEYLTPYYNASEETEFMTALNVTAGDGEGVLVNKAIDYIINKIDENASSDTELEPSDIVDYILHNIYRYNIILNGVTTQINPSALSVMDLSTSGMNYNYTIADKNYSAGANLDNRYLVFRYNMSSTDPRSNKDSGVYSSGRYTVSLASAGNISASEAVEIATVDSNYCSSITTFKPTSPATWAKDEDAKQILNGEILWSLVSTSDSTFEDVKYHENYRISAVPNFMGGDGLTYRNVNINETFVETADVIDDEVVIFGDIYKVNNNKVVINNKTYDVEEVDATHKQITINDNIKLTNTANYRRQLKNFTFNIASGESVIQNNTDYNLYINVIGTSNSSENLIVNIDGTIFKVFGNELYTEESDAYTKVDKVNGHEYSIHNKIVTVNDKEYYVTNANLVYLNSDLFSYTDVLNVLQNGNNSVVNSTLNWSACDRSTETTVYIYGPFDDKFESESEQISVVDTFANKGDLSIWKKAIRDRFSIANDLSLLSSDYRHVLSFPNKVVEDEEGNVNYSRVRSLVLDSTEYEWATAGTYIIRTQEIGDGRGVIDSEFTEKLFVNGNDSDDQGFEPSYGLIARKLATTTKPTYGWLQGGRFVWNAVDGANAYRVTVKQYKFNSDTGNYDLEYKSNSVDVRETYYELENNELYTEDFHYAIEIIALKVNADGYLVDNYFSSDTLETDHYARLQAPNGVSISGNGILSWNENGTPRNVEGYKVYVNGSGDNGKFVSGAQDNTVTKFNLGISDIANGLIDVSVQSIGGSNYLSSLRSTAITIHKIADPEPRIEMGVFKWGTDSSDVSGQNQAKSKLEIQGTSQELGVGVTEFKLYNDVIDTSKTNEEMFKQQYSDSYAVDTYDLSVQFLGGTGTVTADTVLSETFMISSSTVTLSATKLSTPVVKSVQTEYLQGESDKNNLQWAKIPNALGYRVVVFERFKNDSGEDTYAYDIIDSIEESYYYNKDMFSVKDNNVIFELTSILSNPDLNPAQGLSLFVYVQAIGTIDSTTSIGNLYLSSGFSTAKAVTIPAQPLDLSYNGNTGVFSWRVADSDKNLGLNAIITTKYLVTGVSNLFNGDGYWTLTADEIGSSENTLETNVNCNPTLAGRYSEIKHRTVVYQMASDGTYDLFVTDIILLEKENIGTDRNPEWVTPSSYRVTSTARNYSFSMILTIADTIDYNGDYKSEPATLTGNYDFSTFANGDGTTLYPYEINEEAKLRQLGNFLDNHFIITEDIALTSEWSTIDGTFTGLIDGQNHVISNINISSAYARSGNTMFVSFMRENSGTIKNINMQINYRLTGSYSGREIYMAGLASTNNGTISNVNIISVTDTNDAEVHSSLYANYRSRTELINVGGLVVINNGTIENSIVNVGQGTSGIYIMHGSNSMVAKVGGIATRNNMEGIISNTSFTGDIRANYIGGIVCDNYGTLDRVQSSGTAYTTDEYNSSSNGAVSHGLATLYGGLVGIVYGEAQVRNSYTTMRLILIKKTTTPARIGGLVGDVSNNIEAVNISNCYAVVNMKYDNTSSGSNTNTSSVNAYPTLNDTNENITINDVYYIIDSSGNNNITLNNQTNANITECTTLTDLISHVKDLTDSEGSIVFDTSDTASYPKFAK